jgi:hypothetical protein
MFRSISLAGVIYTLALNNGLTQTNNTNDLQLKLSEQQIEDQLMVLKTNKTEESVWLLQKLITNFEKMQSRSNRNEQTRIWFEVISEIDSDLNPSFDENKPDFVLRVIPPPDGEKGIQYQPGIAPDTLKNPVARSQYEAAINENMQKAAVFNFQWTLHRFNERVSVDFESYLKNNYTPAENDKVELKEILEKVKLSPTRKQNIFDKVGLPPENKLPTK